MTRRALVTGATGQDGAFLVEYLLKKGYEVHGTKRRSSSFNTARVDHIYVDPHEHNARLFLHYADLNDVSNLMQLVDEVRPDEIYHLAAQSHVQVSFEMPQATFSINGMGTLHLLECIHALKLRDKVRLLHASSGEIFGNAQDSPHTELSPLRPSNPQAIAKAMAHLAVINYRDAFGLFTSNCILFNHESPARGETFVTRKITRAAARIAAGVESRLYLGALDVVRDWGYAGDYVDAMWKVLHAPRPGEYIVATGAGHSVREFAEEAFRHVGIGIRWEGKRLNEKGVREDSGETIVEVDPRYIRPVEVNRLIGDSTRIRSELGWAPTIGFRELVALMMEKEQESLQSERQTAAKDSGLSRERA